MNSLVVLFNTMAALIVVGVWLGWKLWAEQR